MGFILKGLPALLPVVVPLLAQIPPAIRVDVNLVRVPCIVTHANGVPVHGLSKNDFVVLENGISQEVKYRWQELDLPLTVVVMVETCGQPGFVKQHTDITLRFLQRVLSKNDQAAIVAVSGQAWLVTDLTDSRDQLRSGAEDLGRPSIRRSRECPASLAV